MPPDRPDLEPVARVGGDIAAAPPPKRARLRAGGCLGTCLAVFFLLVGYLGWANWLPSLPEAPPPPIPNGYDLIVAAARKLPPEPLTRIGPLADPSKYSIQEVKEALASSQPVFSDVRRALSVPSRVPSGAIHRKGDGHAQRELLRRLSSDSRVSWKEGRPGRALETALDLVEVGDRFSRGGGMLERMLGGIAVADGVAAGERCVPELSASSARAATARFDSLLSPWEGPVDAVHDTGVDSAQEYRRQLRDTGAVEAMVAHALWGFNYDPADRGKRALVWSLARLYPRSYSMQALRAYWARAEVAAQKPGPLIPIPRPSDLLAADYVSMVEQMLGHPCWEWRRTRTSLLLLRTELALHEYRLKHGSYPATLTPLRPEYLSVLPLDPFSNRPFIYRPEGAGYLLYSVGADGVDDGGRPAQPIGFPAPPNTATGDLVAGKLKAGAF